MSSRSVLAQPSESTAAALWVYLLGPLAVAWASPPLAVHRRQVRALLHLPTIRLQLILRKLRYPLFWPDIPESTARFYLTRLLTHLHRALPAAKLLVAKGSISKA